MPKARVVLNKRVFGAEVMSSAALEAQLRPFAERVADQMPDATITAIRTGAGSANSRVRLRVESDLHERERLIAAIRSVLSNSETR
jgi:hypothetical protein